MFHVILTANSLFLFLCSHIIWSNLSSLYMKLAVPDTYNLLHTEIFFSYNSIYILFLKLFRWILCQSLWKWVIQFSSDLFPNILLNIEIKHNEVGWNWRFIRIDLILHFGCNMRLLDEKIKRGCIFVWSGQDSREIIAMWSVWRNCGIH